MKEIITDIYGIMTMYEYISYRICKMCRTRLQIIYGKEQLRL